MGTGTRLGVKPTAMQFALTSSRRKSPKLTKVKQVLSRPLAEKGLSGRDSYLNVSHIWQDGNSLDLNVCMISWSWEAGRRWDVSSATMPGSN